MKTENKKDTTKDKVMSEEDQITQEIVQLIEQLKEKVIKLESLGFNVRLYNLPDSGRYFKSEVQVYKPIFID